MNPYPFAPQLPQLLPILPHRPPSELPVQQQLTTATISEQRPHAEKEQKFKTSRPYIYTASNFKYLGLHQLVEQFLIHDPRAAAILEDLQKIHHDKYSLYREEARLNASAVSSAMPYAASLPADHNDVRIAFDKSLEECKLLILERNEKAKSGKISIKLPSKRKSASSATATKKKRKKSEGQASDSHPTDDENGLRTSHFHISATKKKSKKENLKLDETSVEIARMNLWSLIVKKQIPKAAKMYTTTLTIVDNNCRKISALAVREVARVVHSTQGFRSWKDYQLKGRKITREMQIFWKKNEKDEKEARKRAEKEELEKRRAEEEAREMRRQARKLNFLISQTELYSHFIANKKDLLVREASPDNIPKTDRSVKELIDEDGNEEELAERAKESAIAAMTKQQSQVKAFDMESKKARNDLELESSEDQLSYLNPSSMPGTLLEQPKMLKCTLKAYQLKGLAWLANLYEQGINGILADEMGLGKTVQSISLLAYLAESQGIWGPFVVVAPASTLHNWQQELARFVPTFKTLPYWGSVSDRKTLRKFWTGSKLGKKDSPFHVLVTSYQLLVSDEKAFGGKVHWQYMILDEAQALKSSSSVRWKTLLGFKCRNRLLLTGTPIQNSMQELWALLHFIMPTLFDSHDEFSEWFSKDIESHAEHKSGLNERQLKRLHMILKPFMLRRVKKDVENELGDKIEIDIDCKLSPKQRKWYDIVRKKLRQDHDLLLKKMRTGATTGTITTSVTLESHLANLVMQFRKICNHTELMVESQVKSPLVIDLDLNYSSSASSEIFGMSRNPINVNYPIAIQELDVRRPVAESILSFCKPKEDVFLQGVLAWLSCLESQAYMLDQGVWNPRFLAIEKEIPLFTLPVAPIFEKSYCRILPKVLCSSPSLSYKRPPLDSGVSLVPLESHLSTRATTINGPCLVQLPSPENLVSDSGKLAALDTLLERLKREGHRVLVYFQMTRMMNLMEDYCRYRRHSYIRLDGSTKISDRRDLVHDWQTDASLFIFILSTRAGGLGINLTAADTVIFYDSDWNPTVDQQAMDRAHRLGQTKQVTVYRLITKGTIEERIKLKAAQKHEIQKVVIAGGEFKQAELGSDRERPDEPSRPEGHIDADISETFQDPVSELKGKDLVSLLLDEDQGYSDSDY